MSDGQTSYSAVLGVVLASIRNSMGVDQNQMAEKMGLSQASYSRLESGKASFTVDQMYQAASALDVAVLEIVDRVEGTVQQLMHNGVDVKAQSRASTLQAKSDDSGIGNFIAGAALGGLLVGLLSKK